MMLIKKKREKLCSRETKCNMLLKWVKLTVGTVYWPPFLIIATKLLFTFEYYSSTAVVCHTANIWTSEQMGLKWEWYVNWAMGENSFQKHSSKSIATGGI